MKRKRKYVTVVIGPMFDTSKKLGDYYTGKELRRQRRLAKQQEKRLTKKYRVLL